jgi:hypothetical protein
VHEWCGCALMSVACSSLPRMQRSPLVVIVIVVHQSAWFASCNLIALP